MNLFDILVAQALTNRPELNSLRIVVEKELLHHDILRVMQEHDLLLGLTFIGGTCLRVCYGSNRLSEDLDFTGGADFSRDTLALLGSCIASMLEEKYGLSVTVSSPEKDISNVDTWKIKVITRPEKKHMPAQRINIDVCSVPSYEKTPLLVQNFYGVEMGSSNVIVMGQSREEIFADKILAFALRPNRIKYRDLWDIVWLHFQGISPRVALIELKLVDRHRTKKEFDDLLKNRFVQLKENADAQEEFKREMERFLPGTHIPNKDLENYWNILLRLMQELVSTIAK